MRLTKDLLEAGLSASGGLTKEQFILIHVGWPPREGWKERCLGTEITEEEARQFLALRGLTERVKKKGGPVVLWDEDR